MSYDNDGEKTKKEKKVKAPAPPRHAVSMGTMSHRGPLGNSVLVVAATNLFSAMSQPSLPRRLRNGYRRAAALVNRATPIGVKHVLNAR